MKTLFRFIGTIFGIIAAAVGVLTILEKFAPKKEYYLDLSDDED